MRIGYDGKRAVQNFTGLGNYSRYVVQSLSAFAPENEYWLYAPVHRENQQLSSMVAESRGTVSVHYPSYWLWRGMTSLWRVGGIRRTLKRDNIQLFHGLSNELPLTIHRVREVKSVVTVHDLIFLRLSHCFSLVDRLIYNYKCRYACKHADHIIAVSVVPSVTSYIIMEFLRIKFPLFTKGVVLCMPAVSVRISARR